MKLYKNQMNIKILTYFDSDNIIGTKQSAAGLLFFECRYAEIGITARWEISPGEMDRQEIERGSAVSGGWS